MVYLETESNFLGIEEEQLYAFESSKVVVQSAPYEHTSSYLSGSAKGPAAIINASKFVEFYDEELDKETLYDYGISTLPPMNFYGKVDADAIALIEKETGKLIEENKFVVSLGAEHTVTLGFFNAHQKKYPNLSILQIDAHSDLRDEYNGNKFSHASVMARIHEKGAKIFQAGIRAQCKEEAELIKNSELIHTWYAHQIRKNPDWQNEINNAITGPVYITIDADGFDPSVIPAVGTAEPGGLYWEETLDLLKKVCSKHHVVGFDIVETAPRENSILSEFSLAKLIYKILGYRTLHPDFKNH